MGIVIVVPLLREVVQDPLKAEEVRGSRRMSQSGLTTDPLIRTDDTIALQPLHTLDVHACPLFGVRNIVIVKVGLALAGLHVCHSLPSCTWHTQGSP